MKSRTFSNGLVVKHRRSAIILENRDGKEERQERFRYDFTPEEYNEFIRYIIQIANESWKNIQPKEADSMASDYDEYYDRRYDDNGSLGITETGIIITAPYWSVDTLYQFNKPKIQSFIYDLLERQKQQQERHT